MARAKWRFGNQPIETSQQSSSAAIPAVSSADGKKFGLENFGNTCYANSVIQALYFCSPFRELLLQAPDRFTLQAESQSRLLGKLSTGAIPETTANGVPTVFQMPASPPTLFSALRSLFLHISTNPSDQGTVAPRAFIDKLREVNDVFRSTMHQDAHEFLNYLLNRLIDELEEERKSLKDGSTPTEDLSNSITTLASKASTAPTGNSVGKDESTLIHKLFEGVLTSETRCLTCETVSSRDEVFLDLSIDIEQNSSVTACLRQFSASEMLCQKNKFFCDSCCDLQEAEKRMKIKKLPNVLALHLKRFKFQEDLQKYIKLAYRVAFPMQLRLFNTVDDTEDADRLYDLFGIVVHIGNGPHHGHYISVIKSLGTWLVFDDDNVYPLPENEIPKYFGESNSGSAYVLYYQAVDIDPQELGLRVPSIPEPAEQRHQFTPTPPPQSFTVLPPGLTNGGDSSDFSEPPFPPTPSQSSPLLSYSDKEKEARVPNGDEVPVASTSGSTLLSTPSSGTPAPTVSPKSSKGLFGKRTPSTSKRPSTSATVDSRRVSDVPPIPPVSMAETSSPISPFMTPVVQVNGKEKEKEKEKEHSKPERKSSTWFGKRKSVRAASEYGSPPLDEPSSPHGSPSNWFRTSSHSPDKPRRQEHNFFDANTFRTLSPRPQSSAGPQQNRDMRAGYDSPSPGSASSSVGSSSMALPPPVIPVYQSPPPRKGSLNLDPSLHYPEHKKSLSSLPKERKRHSSANPRPATATGSSGDYRHLRPVPPVPAIPSSAAFTPLAQSFDKGKTKEDSKESFFTPLRAPELSAGSGTNHSTGSNGSGNSSGSNFKRATRKLSLTSPILGLGFGRRDREKKERDREKESGKGPPSSFSNSPVLSK